MIRPLSVLFLLGASAIVLAQPLYRWVEPDGSITFSVKPPAAGIDYERVETPKSADSAISRAASGMKAQQVSTPEAVQPAEAVGSMPEATIKSVQAVKPAPRVAPFVGVQSGLQADGRRAANPLSALSDRRGNANTSAEGNAEQGMELFPGESQRMDVAATRSRKQRQCEDLQKRVISLEGRLRNRLTPEDMDNTVVHMARYQRSFDQHCVQ